MARILRTKMIARHSDDRETHEIELDGLPSLEITVDLPRTITRLKTPEKREEHTRTLVINRAQEQIDALDAAHAG